MKNHETVRLMMMEKATNLRDRDRKEQFERLNHTDVFDQLVKQIYESYEVYYRVM